MAVLSGPAAGELRGDCGTLMWARGRRRGAPEDFRAAAKRAAIHRTDVEAGNRDDAISEFGPGSFGGLVQGIEAVLW